MFIVPKEVVSESYDSYEFNRGIHEIMKCLYEVSLPSINVFVDV